MRILQISDGYGEILGRGPLENVVFNISRRMAKMGYGVTILERDRTEKVSARDVSFGNAWLLRHQLHGQHTSESIVISRTEMGDKLLQLALFQRKIWLAKIEKKCCRTIADRRSFLQKEKSGGAFQFAKASRKKCSTTLNLSKLNFASYLSSILVYLSVYISSKQYGRRILRNSPLSLLRVYQLFLHALSRFLS
jgi:hypothetical protein